jgi:hypothetical protein
MPRPPPQEKRIMATRTSGPAGRKPASKAKRRVTTGKDAVGTRTAGAARKPTRKTAVARKRAAAKAPAKKVVRKASAQKTARKAPAKKTAARKAAARKSPAKKAARKAPRKLTTAQAAAKIQALLEAKHERERVPPPWAEAVPHTAGADDNGDPFHAHEAPPGITHSPTGTAGQIIQPKRGQRS